MDVKGFLPLGWLGRGEVSRRCWRLVSGVGVWWNTTGISHPLIAGGGTLVLGHTLRPVRLCHRGWGSADHSLHNPWGVSRFDRARPRPGGSGGVWEVFEHFSGDVAFQDSGDLSHGLAFSESPGDIVTGSLVVSHPGDHHVVEG